MTLSIIRLELARDPTHPSGSAEHGYEFVAPLGAAGHIDVEPWAIDYATYVDPDTNLFYKSKAVLAQADGTP